MAKKWGGLGGFIDSFGDFFLFHPESLTQLQCLGSLAGNPGQAPMAEQGRPGRKLHFAATEAVLTWKSNLDLLSDFTSGCFWPPLTSFLLPLNVFDQFWPLLPLLATFAHFGIFPTFWPPLDL